MAAPTTLSQAWWSKHKPKTLKSTGFGALMGEWEKALALPESKANFVKMAAALAKLEPGRKTALAMCNKTLHKDGIANLGAYQGLITKADAALKKRSKDYDDAVKAWHKVRTECLAGMKKQEPKVSAMEGRVSKGLKLAGTTDATRAGKVISTLLDETKALRKETKAVMDTVRIAGEGAAPLHADDRDPSDFSAAIAIQSRLDRDHTHWETALIAEGKKYGLTLKGTPHT